MIRACIAAAFCVALAGSPAMAQLRLQGAAPSASEPAPAPGAPEAAPVKRAEAKPRPKKPAPAKPVTLANVVGKPLTLNGAAGALRFSAAGAGLKIDQLSLVGEGISKSSRQCKIDIVASAPIEVKSLGRPEGVDRFSADIPACPFEFDVLDGAIMAPDLLRACVFADADCQASPAGLWGPASETLPGDPKLGRQARAVAEASMTEAYRELEGRLNDPVKSTDLAAEQSAFLADRADHCRAYAGEAIHQFCATRLAEARAAALKARADALAPAPIVKPASAKRRRPAEKK